MISEPAQAIMKINAVQPTMAPSASMAGSAVPAGRVVGAGDVLDAATEIGYPITLKALGHAHKSEAGAVKVTLAPETGLRPASRTTTESGAAKVVRIVAD